jgi:hypothetical protein
MRQLAGAVGMELIVDTGGEDEWQQAVAGLEDEPEGGARCDVCFLARLRHAARKARELGCEVFTTTLTISPHKPLERVAPAGEQAAAQAGVRFLAEDFKKKDGFRRSVELSKQYGLHRQRYCGCVYSMRDVETGPDAGE